MRCVGNNVSNEVPLPQVICIHESIPVICRDYIMLT